MFAEIDLLCALSACAQGAVAVPCGAREPVSSYGLQVEVFSARQDILGRFQWNPLPVAEYQGRHGLVHVIGGQSTRPQVSVTSTTTSHLM